MALYSCGECEYCKVYPGSYWDPGDAECTCPGGEPNDIAFEGMPDDELVERAEKAWEEWDWDRDEEDRPLCPWYIMRKSSPYDEY